MDHSLHGRPRNAQHDSSVILHFDYDCFYASVFEVENPLLKTLPLAVQQKQIIVTCNYEARRRGLHKLQLVREAKRICPEVIIVLGEDLTKFRDASKACYDLLRSFSWNDKVERLGLDEVFMDVTDVIDYNISLLNLNTPQDSFFCLSSDPTHGFRFDAASIAGHTHPADIADAKSDDISSHDHLRLRLQVASHFALYLRLQLEEHKGFTSTVGISTSKLVSKLAGNLHKPKGQTTLLPPYTGEDNNVVRFLDEHEIGKIPGVGAKIASSIREHILRRPNIHEEGLVTGLTKDLVTVRDARLFPGMSPETLERILAGPGAPRGIGLRVWNLINGSDNSQVGQARSVPKQISIEDSYLELDTLDEVVKELGMLARSLLKRMRTDLVEDYEQPNQTTLAIEGEVLSQPAQRWLAHPKTLRLSTRPRPPPNPDGTRNRSFNRISTSLPMPSFAFVLTETVDSLADRLVFEALVPAFRKLHPEKSGWDLSLVNVAVTNMVDAASESKTASGRDISKMFKQQDAVLREWRIEDRDVPPANLMHQKSELAPPPLPTPLRQGDVPSDRTGSEDMVTLSQAHRIDCQDEWEDDDEGSICGTENELTCICAICGSRMPTFAITAHERFHASED
ncbi:DNA/RNA polymerase [Aulographum hederae CBS 113979]|uniref:DNA/RNA polymerase n=1 Tax=Aulographum hederae CBS 113979 TaxID=1176131 RepID=A0A6G1H7V6_9PEZI|nr:DNA/RNA polymerase [Aulographum hederae CBS 113979]